LRITEIRSWLESVFGVLVLVAVVLAAVLIVCNNSNDRR
jgi:hypothetical protein